MSDYSWVVGVPRGALPDDLRRVHREVVRQRRVRASQRERMTPRACEIVRAYEAGDELAAVRSTPGSILEFPQRAVSQQQDVAIDFPSVTRVVDRIGRGLMATKNPCITQVRLSWREACEGVHVSLKVPVRSTCLVCGGRGAVWSDDCSKCGGVGTESKSHVVHLSIPPGVRPDACFCFAVNPPSAPKTDVEVHVTIQ